MHGFQRLPSRSRRLRQKPYQRETSVRTVHARLSHLISGSGIWHQREALNAENIKYPPLGLRARETFELDLSRASLGKCF